MKGVKRSFKAIGEGGVFKRVCGGLKKSGGRAGYLTSGESSPAPIGSDKGHPCSFKRYLSDQEERYTGLGSGRMLPGRATLQEEVEAHSGTHRLQ